MTNWCPPEPVTFKDCPPLEPPTSEEKAADQAANAVAEAINEAALRILASDGTTECHEDGGVDWGEPSFKDCKGGTVKTGIVTPQEWSGPCFVAADYRYTLVVTWDKRRHTVARVSEETARINRKIVDVVCCLLPVPEGEWAAPTVTLESSLNSNGEADDRCPYFSLTFKVA